MNLIGFKETAIPRILAQSHHGARLWHDIQPRLCGHNVHFLASLYNLRTKKLQMGNNILCVQLIMTQETRC